MLRQRPPPITSDIQLNVGVALVRMLVASFLRLFLSALMLPAFVAGTNAQEIRIGVVGPLSGPFQLLGEQFANGARIAAASDTVILVEADDECTPEGGKAAARSMAQSQVEIVVGFLCTPALEAAMPILSSAGIAVITPVRTSSLTDQAERTGWRIWRIAPRADDELTAVAEILTAKWRREHFAIVDDGTIYGRDLAETFRAEAELARLRPVLVDTFRPQLDNQIGLIGRLRRSGATHVFVGGDRFDVAIMARDAAKIGYDVVFAGGEALRAAEEAILLPEGILMIATPRWEDLASPETTARFEKAGIVPEGYVMQGHAAIDVATGAIRAAANEGTPIDNQLDNFTFDTAIGLIRFDEKGDLADNPYRLFRHDGTVFHEVTQ